MENTLTKNNVITLDLENGTFEENFLDDNFGIGIMLDGKEIGFIIGFACQECVLIKLISLEEGFRRKGYGTLAMQELIRISKKLNCHHIEADCRTELISFYKRLGADFTHRDPDDATYINHRFYIDL
ncbi:GNAT family N-acetyltransferase [Clostridium perfringens]